MSALPLNGQSLLPHHPPPPFTGALAQAETERTPKLSPPGRASACGRREWRLREDVKEASLTFESPSLGEGGREMRTQVMGKGEDKLRSRAGLPNSALKDQRLHNGVTPASCWALGRALEGLTPAELVSSLGLFTPQPRLAKQSLLGPGSASIGQQGGDPSRDTLRVRPVLPSGESCGPALLPPPPTAPVCAVSDPHPRASPALTKPCLSEMLLVSFSLWKATGLAIHCSPVAGLSGWMYMRLGISGSALPATIQRELWNLYRQSSAATMSISRMYLAFLSRPLTRTLKGGNIRLRGRERARLHGTWFYVGGPHSAGTHHCQELPHLCFPVVWALPPYYCLRDPTCGCYSWGIPFPLVKLSLVIWFPTGFILRSGDSLSPSFEMKADVQERNPAPEKYTCFF